MFPNTQKIDGKIAVMRQFGATPFNSQEMRELVIAQASPWFPGGMGEKKYEIIEEHLVERRIIPSPPNKKRITAATASLHRILFSPPKK